MPTGVYVRTEEHRKKLSETLKGRVFSPEHRRKISEAGRRSKHYNWKGGRRNCRGYVLVWCPNHPHATHDGYVQEHRLVMEAHLGRTLLPTEVVHHINGIKDDNRIENLMLFSNKSDHVSFHRKQRN